MVAGTAFVSHGNIKEFCFSFSVATMLISSKKRFVEWHIMQHVFLERAIKGMEEFLVGISPLGDLASHWLSSLTDLCDYSHS